MEKIYFAGLVALLIFSCSKDNDNIMHVKGHVKGLKKGTFYLQKQVDSVIVSVDSIQVNGSDKFLISTSIESPEMYYLKLGKSNKRVAFFGEKDTITINSSLDKFELKAKIGGSENQDLLDEYFAVKSKFSDRNLDLIKKEFEVKKSGNQDSVLIIQRKMERLVKTKYLYAINFAINNSDHEVAPYIALSELVNANVKYLDTINKSLTPKVKDSKYGRQLDKFIVDIKESEK